MLTAVVICFILGYVSIVFEHPLRLDKTVPALIMGALCWAFISLGDLDVVDTAGQIYQPAMEAVGEGSHGEELHLGEEPGEADTHVVGHHKIDHTLEVLLHHIGKIAEILFFLIGAMTIVEIIDMHRGFSVITNRISTTSKRKMLIIISILAFFLSATLDNLASTIVLVSLLRRMVPKREERLWFVSLAVIGANAGGAWSPIGDVTTTMLWIGKKVSTLGLIEHLVIPSFVCLAIPVAIATFLPAFRGNITKLDTSGIKRGSEEKLLSSSTMLYVGVSALVFVPVFKAITHLPPYVGMMLSLGVVWLVSEYIRPVKNYTAEQRHQFSAHRALSRIEMSSILFFLGILAAVAALESVAVVGVNGDQVGLLKSLAERLQVAIPSQDIVVLILGGLSAVIDNVPLVAATMGMYTQPMDAKLWHFIAYSAGTGGSMLIIGSAAGVAAMGMERINFIWYMRKIGWLALVGFLGGALTFIAMDTFIWH